MKTDLLDTNESKKKVAYCINTSKVNKTLEGKWQSYRVRGNSRKINYLRKPDSLMCNTSVGGQKKKKNWKPWQVLIDFQKNMKAWLYNCAFYLKIKYTQSNNKKPLGRQIKTTLEETTTLEIKTNNSPTILNSNACGRALDVFISGVLLAKQINIPLEK